jgi:hypothetical protein
MILLFLDHLFFLFDYQLLSNNQQKHHLVMLNIHLYEKFLLNYLLVLIEENLIIIMIDYFHHRMNLLIHVFDDLLILIMIMEFHSMIMFQDGHTKLFILFRKKKTTKGKLDIRKRMVKMLVMNLLLV